MNNAVPERSPYTQLIYRPFWITITCLLVISAVALAIQVKSSWNALHRSEPLKAHLMLVEDMQHYSAELDELINAAANPSQQLQSRLEQFVKAVNTSLLNAALLGDEAHAAIWHTTTILGNVSTTDAIDAMQLAKKDFHQALHAETHSLNQMLSLLAKDNRLELETGTFIAITLPLLGMLMLFFLRHHILRPLDGLGLLINRLGKQSLPAIPLDRVDPLLKPLFVDFNHMVQRLAELETEHQQHQRELEEKVRLATQSLLEYHHTLAQSERLAAVGELTAGLAHELRNPLAGMHLALANLRNEMVEPDHVERLSLIIESLQSITTMLNQVLNQSQHTPEPNSRFYLRETVSSLLQLVRYQISPEITLEKQIADDIYCHLPQGRLRQALLNLILNAAQCVDDTKGYIVIEAQPKEEGLIIHVMDNGPGFPEELLANGIQPFVTGREQGTGLGLAIVRRFCHEQGGNFTVSNLESGGACAEMTLPWKP